MVNDKVLIEIQGKLVPLGVFKKSAIEAMKICWDTYDLDVSMAEISDIKTKNRHGGKSNDN